MSTYVPSALSFSPACSRWNDPENNSNAAFAAVGRGTVSPVMLVAKVDTARTILPWPNGRMRALANGALASALAQSPLPLQMHAKVAEDIGASRVLWCIGDDAGFCALTGLAAQDDELTSMPDSSKASWPAALIRGCTRSDHFEVAACCALTLEKMLPGCRITSEAAVRVLRAMWRFLGDQNGCMQHAAAFVWVSLLQAWPFAAAYVIAEQLRTANEELLATHIARFSLVWRAALLAATPACLTQSVKAPRECAWSADLCGHAKAERDAEAEQTPLERQYPDSSFESAAPPVPGIAMMLALDALHHPATLVRTAAQHWLVVASATPRNLVLPLLSLLLSTERSHRLHVYSLAKLRSLLVNMPTGTVSLLSQQLAPPFLSRVSIINLEQAARRGAAAWPCSSLFHPPVGSAAAQATANRTYGIETGSAATRTLKCLHGAASTAYDQSHSVDRRWTEDSRIMPDGVGEFREAQAQKISLLQVMTASALAVLLRPATEMRRGSHALAADLIAAIVYAAPRPLGKMLAKTLLDALFLRLQACT